MDMSYESFITDLQSAFPELRLREPNLPHMAMGELVILLENSRQAPARFKELSDRALCFVERAGSSADDRLVNLVAVSFLENLHTLGSDCHQVVDRLGPGGRRALKQVSGSVCPPS
jgi:hypothetical protein